MSCAQGDEKDLILTWQKNRWSGGIAKLISPNRAYKATSFRFKWVFMLEKLLITKIFEEFTDIKVFHGFMRYSMSISCRAENRYA